MTERDNPLSAPQGAEAFAVATGANPPEAPMRTGRRWPAVGRYFARTGWIHLLLICGVGIFLLPFAWMVGMSLKTDDEAADPAFFPAVPTFRAAGPSVRPTTPLPPPGGLAADRWAELRPAVREAAETTIAKQPLPAGGDNVDGKALRAAAADALVDSAAARMPQTVWAGSTRDVVAAFQKTATPDLAADALTNHLARFEIAGLEVHDAGSHVSTAVAHADVAHGIRVVSGPGQLIAMPGGGAYLKYHFASGSDQPIVLRTTFDSPVGADDLQNVVLSYKGDDSWHRVNATLTVDGRRWDSAQTTYIAQYRDAAITFQPPSYLDDTYQAKTWVPMTPVAGTAGAAKTAGHPAELTITVAPSGTAQAMWGKVERNYRRAFRAVPFWTYVGNSVLLVALTVVGQMFSATFVGYAFARLRWPGRTVAFGLLLATMMLPQQVTMIPSFVIWKSLGWYNTLNPLWIGAWTGSAFFIFLMVQFMRTIPKELEEAARIDGLNTVQTWWYVIVPLVKPTLAAIAIMVFMASWNDFLGPLVMLRDQGRFPLSLGLFGLNIDQQLGGGWTVIMAGNMLMTLPVVAVFFLFQRYFIEGVTVSGMKG